MPNDLKLVCCCARFFTLLLFSFFFCSLWWAQQFFWWFSPTFFRLELSGVDLFLHFNFFLPNMKCKQDSESEKIPFGRKMKFYTSSSKLFSAQPDSSPCYNLYPMKFLIYLPSNILSFIVLHLLRIFFSFEVGVLLCQISLCNGRIQSSYEREKNFLSLSLFDKFA